MLWEAQKLEPRQQRNGWAWLAYLEGTWTQGELSPSEHSQSSRVREQGRNHVFQGVKTLLSLLQEKVSWREGAGFLMRTSTAGDILQVQLSCWSRNIFWTCQIGLNASGYSSALLVHLPYVNWTKLKAFCWRTERRKCLPLVGSLECYSNYLDFNFLFQISFLPLLQKRPESLKEDVNLERQNLK